MTAKVVQLTSEHLTEFVAALETAAGRHVSAAAVSDARDSYQMDRMLAVFDQGRIVGGTGSDALELTVPGPAIVPAARLMLTAVLPTHRGRGIYSEMMTRQFRDLRARGEPIAIGTTILPGILRRFDMQPSTAALEIEIEPGLGSRDGHIETSSTLQILAKDELPTFLPRIFDRHRRMQPGQVSRRDYFWRTWLLDRELYRVGSSERFAILYRDEGAKEQGYLTYRLDYGLLREQPITRFIVEDLVAVNDVALRALWEFCLAFDQAAVIAANNVPADDYLWWLVADRRSLRVTGVRDFLWLRLIDVPMALTARRYAIAGTFVFDVGDSLIPENTGRYQLEGGPDGADCASTSRSADLSVTVGDLAAAYFGRTRFSTLARVGRVTEFTAGALGQLDRMFATRPTPWTVTDW